MDVRLLPALRAIGTGQWRGAVKAIPLMRSAISIGFAGAGFDGARKHPSGYCGAKRVKFAHQLPLGSNIRPADWRVLAARSMARIGLLGGSFNGIFTGPNAEELMARWTADYFVQGVTAQPEKMIGVWVGKKN